LNSELLGRFKSADEPIEGGGLLANAFPYELPFSFFQYWRARQVVNDVREKFGSLPSENVFNVSVDSPEVVVLVIGESSSRRAWHLFDSEVEMTTPLLESRLHVRGLYPLSNVIAQSVSTRQSVPSMLTSQPLIWPDGTANENATQSIVSAAANAGYMTAWFSNQAAVGEHDGVVSTYAQEAHISAFLNPSGFWMKGSYDDVLLMPLERYLRNNVRVFVVMHTMGSHFDFSHRYPPGFGVFPFAEGVKETYLNSISYTDWFLEQVILMLERDGRSAVLLYASDHGQGLPGGECKRDRINRLSREAYEVPVFIWLSRSYESSHPAVAGLLKKNENFPYTLAAIPQTVVDLVNGVAVFGKGCEDKQSFLRVQFGDSPQSIAIAPGRWVDFRRAVLRNPCSLFID
ncbi:MAG: phosphoethanolamine transferase, partial [Pseudomonadota bacterium]